MTLARNITDRHAVPAMLDAARRGDGYEVNYLLQDSYSSVAVDVRDERDWTPLMWAAFYGHQHVVTGLLRNRARVNALNTKRQTPLMLAALCGHCNALEELLESGAYVDVKDELGATAFIKAAECGHADAINLLWRYRARMKIKANHGYTAMFAATTMWMLSKSCCRCMCLPTHPIWLAIRRS